MSGLADIVTGESLRTFLLENIRRLLIPITQWEYHLFQAWKKMNYRRNLKNNSILQVIVAHFLIDFTNSLFVEQPASSSAPQLILFGVLLVAEAIYALWLTKAKKISGR